MRKEKTMNVIKNLFHVSLQQNDYQGALDFYCGKLGFEQMFELNVGQFKDMLQLGEHDEHDAMPWLTYLRVAPEEYLEMFNGSINPPDFLRKPICPYPDTAFESFGLGCENVAWTAERLKERGVAVEDGCMTDPSGCRIRLVERKGHAAEQERLFTSLAGVSLYVNDLDTMADHLSRMTFRLEEKTADRALFTAGETGQYVELLKAPAPVRVYDDDLLGHIALQIYKVTDTVKAWGANGAYCCPQPFLRDVQVPADDTAVGNLGLDGCEIIWMVCPEGNKIEVMVQPGNTTQQEWERKHPY